MGDPVEADLPMQPLWVADSWLGFGLIGPSQLLSVPSARQQHHCSATVQVGVYQISNGSMWKRNASSHLLWSDMRCDVLRVGTSTKKVLGCHGYNNKHAHERDGNYKENILWWDCANPSLVWQVIHIFRHENIILKIYHRVNFRWNIIPVLKTQSPSRWKAGLLLKLSIIYVFTTQTIIAKSGLFDPHIDWLLKKLVNNELVFLWNRKDSIKGRSTTTITH